MHPGAGAGDLPPGAGLGSSAALAVAVLRALGDLFDLGFGDRDLVDLANAVENGPFVGARAVLARASPVSTKSLPMRHGTRQDLR